MRASLRMRPALSIASPMERRYLSRSPGVAGTLKRGFWGLGTQKVASTLTGQSRGVFGATVRAVAVAACIQAGSFFEDSIMRPPPTCRFDPLGAGSP